MVDLEYVAVERAGPSTTYELVPDAEHGAAHDYGADRPGGEGDRPGQGADRPVIGRFGSHKKKAKPPQLNGAVEPTGDLSAGIGRVEGEDEKALLSSENPPKVPDRPGLRQIRGTGADGDERVVVDRAGVGGS